MKHDWKRRLLQRLFTGAMAMYKQDVPADHDAGFPDPDFLLSRMTLVEKIRILGGVDDLAVPGIPRLSIPKVWMSDASSGVRCFKQATAFPAGIMLAALWDRSLIYQVGSAIADECRAQGISVILGPGVNIARVPVCGRNFEYFGEDPFLAGDMAVSYIRGVQERGVMAVAKHFACNNSEFDRHKSNSVVDAKTLHEIYLAPFEHAVIRGSVNGVMTSYNQINGIYGAQHPYLLDEVLRTAWGFSGVVISDWNSLYHTEAAVHHGVDIEMPKARKMTVRKVKRALRSGRITEDMIDRKVRRILTVCSASEFYSSVKDESRGLNTEKHRALALKAAESSVVLLKNRNSTLPMKKGCTVSVLGRCAVNTPTGGGGSSFVPVVSGPGIAEALEGEGFRVLRDDSDDSISSSDYVVVAAGFDRFYESEAYDRPYRLLEEDLLALDRACRINSKVIVMIHAGGDVETSSWIDKVQAVIFTGYLGMHRGTAPARVLSGAVNPSGKLPFTMARQLDDHGAMKGYPAAPWNISFVRVIGPQGNPRIRKPRTLEYQEGVFVGYRWFDEMNLSPQFPFGHGLSYTDFEITEAEAAPLQAKAGSNALTDPPIVTVSCRITNTGDRAGAQVVQLYVHEKTPKTARPEQELKGFEKIFLYPGESRTAAVELNTRAFMHHDGQQWALNPGVFELRIGTSSREIHHRMEVHIIDS